MLLYALISATVLSHLAGEEIAFWILGTAAGLNGAFRG